MSFKKIFFFVLVFVISALVLFKIGAYLFYIEMTSTFPLLQEDCYELNLVDFEQRIQSQEGWKMEKTMLTGNGDNTYQRADLLFNKGKEILEYRIKYREVKNTQMEENISFGVIAAYKGEMGIGGAQKSDTLVTDMMIFLNEELLQIFKNDRCK